MDMDHERIPVLDKFILMVILASCLNLTACAARDPVYWTATDRALLLKKEKQEETDRYGNTPLLWAVEEDQKDIVEFLIRENVDINIKNSVTGSTAVILAVKGNHLDILNTLIDSGADIEARDNSGLSALDWASRRGNREIVLALIRSPSHGTLLSKGNALVYAVYSNDLDTIQFLVKKGASIDAPDMYGDTPIIAAVKINSTEIAKYLLDLGVDSHPLDGLGRTPLMLAAQAGYVDMASFVIAQGGNVNGQNELGFTPLMSASANSQSEMVDYLLQNGGDPNIRDSNGLSAIFLAAQNSDLQTVVRLLEGGADLYGERTGAINDNPFATAFMYEIAGDYYLGLGAKKEAVDFYELAEKSFISMSDRYEDRARKESTKEFFSMFGEVLMVSLVTYAEQEYVESQARQQAQISALSSANTVGEYNQMVSISLPIYEQHAQIASNERINRVNTWLYSDSAAATSTRRTKEEFARLSEKTAAKAEQLGAMLLCLRKSSDAKIKDCRSTK